MQINARLVAVAFFLCKHFSHEISSRSIFLVEKIDEISNQHNAEEQFVTLFFYKDKNRINDANQVLLQYAPQFQV